MWLRFRFRFRIVCMHSGDFGNQCDTRQAASPGMIQSLFGYVEHISTVLDVLVTPLGWEKRMQKLLALWSCMEM